MYYSSTPEVVKATREEKHLLKSVLHCYRLKKILQEIYHAPGLLLNIVEGNLLQDKFEAFFFFNLQRKGLFFCSKRILR